MKIAIIIVFLTIVLLTLISSGLADSKKISHSPIIDASIWTVRESGCQGDYTETWTRRPGTNTFDMSWDGSKDVADISYSGNEVTVSRRGNHGTYTGTISPDGMSISDGTATWYMSCEEWSATIDVNKEKSGSQVSEKSRPPKQEVPVKEQKSASEWNKEGVAHFNKEEYDQAIKCLREAIRLDPENSHYWYNLGTSLSYKDFDGNYEEALRCFSESVGIDPHNAKAWYNLGTIIYKMEPDNTYSSISAYEKCIAEDPNYVSAWIGISKAYKTAGNYTGALKSLRKVTGLQPNNGWAWNEKGKIYDSLDDRWSAISNYNQALKININDADAWFDKGYDLIQLKQFDAALEAYDNYTKMRPNDPRGWLNKGVAIGSHLKYDEAIKAYDEAIRLDPKYADAWQAKGLTLDYQGKYDEAIKCYDEAIRQNPNEVDAWTNKGFTLFNQGKYDDSINTFDEAIRLDPNNADAWHNKGAALNALGRTAEADAAYAKAKELVYRG